MKNLFAMTAALMMGFGASASNVELVVEAVDNNGTVPGNTYRVYAVLPSAQHSLHAVFAAEDHVLNVATTGSFFQHQFGSYSSLDVNENIVAVEPGLAFDSWVTVGAKNSNDNNLWTIGIDYNNFLAGEELTVTDGAWFVVPTDVQAAAEVGNKVLLMQLTTDGTATGVLNLQGRDGEGCETRSQCIPLERGITPVHDRADNRGVSGGTTDPLLLQHFHQRGLTESGGRLGLVTQGFDLLGSRGIPNGQ